MNNEPIIISPGTIQTTLAALLRVILVLAGGFTAIVGFLGKRDLAGLVGYIQSDDFTPVAGALAAAISLGYGLWKTHQRKAQLLKVEPLLPSHVMQKSTNGTGALSVLMPFAFAIGMSGWISGCATTADDVRLNAGKAFYTAQVAFRAAQQTTLVTCTSPAPRLVEPCQKAIDILHDGALAEGAAFTAQQAGNAADLQTSLVILIGLPSQLAALGVLEAR